ncbi:HNH endonuclease [Hansschlegelia zhihuaiae]|jgi:5-methylcytosine-specific restriction protein A|uniref:Putative HNH nuclease YajD n=1 Tax=Hansschlegelia zhihuaiae TaxID=405005 RepID=A0A4Q0MJZ8_9HYPH|nr:HNH endonuclease signature motif containing protein [Hansschlegelia zhihuaiae]RXF73904.1 HNH endonuclease [Hansschlegelia zhihuaiae]
MGLRDQFRRFSRPVLKTKRWQVLRHQVLERDGWACRSCGSRRRLEVDHVRPVRNAPERAFDAGNLQTLCAQCHTRKTRIECGHPEPSPERRAWSRAVADLAADPATPAGRKTPCWNL